MDAESPRAALIAPAGFDGAEPAPRDATERDSLDPARGRPRSNGRTPPRWLTSPAVTPPSENRQAARGLERRLIENQLAPSSTDDGLGTSRTPEPTSARVTIPPADAPQRPASGAGIEGVPSPEPPKTLPPADEPAGRRAAQPRDLPVPPSAAPSAPADPDDLPSDLAGSATIDATPNLAPIFQDAGDASPLVGGALSEGLDATDHCRERSKHCLPAGLLYRSYLAGEKEPRFALQHLNESGRGPIWEAVLGGRVGIYRNGTRGAIDPEGFQLDIEGAAMTRLDVEEAQDLDAADFRFGIPLTWREGPLAWKVAYAHISSHLGDEYMEKHPDEKRVNYVRDAIVFGASYDPTIDTRVYGEVGLAWHASGGARPLELQFGYEYSPARPGRAMFAAINGHVRQNKSFDSSVNLEAGWQWRGADTGHLYRIGGQYYNGKSMQYEFYDRSESLLGVGMWFDY